jgi:hypothetical protein
MLFRFAIIASIASCLSFAANRASGEDFAIFCGGDDNTYSESLKAFLAYEFTMRSAEIYSTLEDALKSEADVLIIASTEIKVEQPLPAETIELLKKRKCVMIGKNSVRFLQQVDLEISGIFSGIASQKVRLIKNELFSPQRLNTVLDAYNRSSNETDIAIRLPPDDERRRHIDVIATSADDPNSIVIARQGNFLVIGVSASPKQWTDEFKSVFRDILIGLNDRKLDAFAVAELKTTPPGHYDFELGKGFSKTDAFAKHFYVKFDTPTKLKMKLEHDNSNSIMLLFSGLRSRDHWQRVDSKTGEGLSITVNISAEDIKARGDGYWCIRIVNFDKRNTAECRIQIEYDQIKQKH